MTVSFQFTEEQEDIRRAAREFAEKEFTPELARECDREEKFPMELFKKCAKLGFHAVAIPEEYGGGGYGPIEQMIVMEEFSAVNPGLGLACLLPTFGVEILLLHGSEEQKEQYVTKIAKGDAIMGMANTEPDAGSDSASIKTRAVKDGNEWVLNGTKQFISNGSIADFILVTARTREMESFEKRHRGISYFIVETDREGYKADKIKGKMGIRATDTAEVSLNNVRVPESNLVGEEGKGFYYMMEFFDITRVWVAAQAVGIARGALQLVIDYVKQRKAFGLPLAAFQYIQFKIAELATKIEAARTLTYRAAAVQVEQGKPDNTLSAMAKWYAGEVAVETTNWALQFHGGYGYIDEYPINQFYRDAKITEIYEGAKEVEKLIIARNLFGFKGR
ncbi:Acyl-CoA dehydrogenase [Geoglobus ahangari]|uniref:Acyl-CoA dehydrogenase n=1 Tax=Geoglobus ahangari TaxID=113653 RepID=A0A0F7IGZ9_9EURY|nr:acyl-CoA dehydrogenase family protein [Geoglobus ahangari]AKG92167.1 Acyl-CoA dehydrogenase [Geoglobus ahangari]